MNTNTEREELAQTLKRSEAAQTTFEHKLAFHLQTAGDLLRAGYRKPRTITTAEELDALPFESVVRDAAGHVLERWGDALDAIWVTVQIAAYIPRGDIALPATVLYSPEPTK